MSDNSSSPTKIITIVGAGFSGALTAVNVLRQNPGERSASFSLIAAPGRGGGLLTVHGTIIFY